MLADKSNKCSFRSFSFSPAYFFLFIFLVGAQILFLFWGEGVGGTGGEGYYTHSYTKISKEVNRHSNVISLHELKDRVKGTSKQYK